MLFNPAAAGHGSSAQFPGATSGKSPRICSPQSRASGSLNAAQEVDFWPLFGFNWPFSHSKTGLFEFVLGLF
jgi:hypothetical protein